jgi:hypothetical protein
MRDHAADQPRASVFQVDRIAGFYSLGPCGDANGSGSAEPGRRAAASLPHGATLFRAIRFTGFADTSLRSAAVIVTTPAVATVVAAADDAIAIIAPTLEVSTVAIAAAQITVKVRLSVGIRPAVGGAVEIRKALRAIVKVPASFGGTAQIGPPLQSLVEFRARSWPRLEFRSAAGRWFRTATRAAIEVRSAAPAIAVAIKVTVAVVTIPIAAEAEDHDGNTEPAIILRPDIHAALLIKCLDISAVHPATTVVELHVAPWHVARQP